MLMIDNQIHIIDDAICRHIDSISGSTRGAISQDILTKLISFVEHIMLKFYSNGYDLDDDEENIQAAIEFTQVNGELKTLYRFRNYLQIVAVHYTLDENASERLMLKYYQYLLEMKNLVRRHFNIRILHNLNKFPLQLDSALQEYYAKIAERIEQHPAQLTAQGNKYYIQKIKPFYVGDNIYHEVTFTPAVDKATKSSRVIAFTKLPVTSNYASRFQLVESSVEILGKTMPIVIITGWEVSIRDCEFSNFISVVTGDRTKVPYPEQRTICSFLTRGASLTELMDFPDTAYQNLTAQWRANLRSDTFIKVLDRCRKLIRSQCAGSNILRYLLFNMNNAIIKDQRDEKRRQQEWFENTQLSNLYLPNKCIPFDTMPFINSPRNHNPRLSALFTCIHTNGRKHELLARHIRNNTEIDGRIFTPLAELTGYSDIPTLVDEYNNTLWFGHRDRSQLVISHEHLFINEYRLDTCTIIHKLRKIAESGLPNYAFEAELWLHGGASGVDCEEKRVIIADLFSQSRVAVIYGSAGVGKSTLINHVAQLFDAEDKLFLAQTNPAVNNLKRRVKANRDHCEFSTIASFLKKDTVAPECHLLVIDECSIVNNADMVSILQKAKFQSLLLVGDTYQIDSIRFGNWFTAIRHFIPEKAVHELTEPYRARNNRRLLALWAKVRHMDDDVLELIEKQSCSLKVDDSLFRKDDEDEAILCLNYDGLYGINNINRFLQESNPNKPVQWGILQYKVGDPILFLESNRFHPLIYNNMKGKIVGIEVFDAGTVNARIPFDIELEKPIDKSEIMWYPLEYLGESTEGNSIVRFSVYETKNADEEDDHTTSRTIVPFQIAYAVSIHKAQGLEYNSVKIVITDEVDELITHNIFYTAITRAQSKLRIYWTPEVEHKVLEHIRPRNIDSDVELLKSYLSEHLSIFPF